MPRAGAANVQSFYHEEHCCVTGFEPEEYLAWMAAQAIDPRQKLNP
jgi:hypothetical protein